ncbi:MAG: hypothetical protein P0Y59_00150 [Candidatus Sphingomonas phytovorans]|nr:hypothetical protein [Sphingomonas sp.]WEK00150.1 MAG: hypothetical protein P0Y59_00150 [Sphingomonas sp.]
MMPWSRLLLLPLAVALIGAGPEVRISGGGDGIATGKPLRLSVTTAARSSAGNSAQPPFAWIDFDETIDPAAASCEARADRLLQSGPLQPAARDFNAIHVVTLDAAGALHVLDPRNGIRGARSLAHVEFGSAPSAWHWAAADGLIWAALPDAGKLVAVDVARWQIARTVEGLGPVRMLRGAEDGSLYAIAPGTGVHRVDARAAQLMPGTIDVEAIVPGDRDEIWLIGARGVRLIGGHGRVAIDRDLRDAAWSRAADRLIGLTRDGAVVMIARTGVVSDVRDMPAMGAPNGQLWLSPDGRVAVVHDRGGAALQVVDLEKGAFARTIAVDRPVSLAASDSFLFVRSEGRGETMVLPLAELARPAGGGPRWIAGGEPVSATRANAALTASADGLAAWSDAEQNLIYFYHEGMNIPSGTLRNPGPPPDRLLLVGPTIRPVAAGRFEAGFRLERPGRYVAVVMGTQPRFVQCTAFEVRGPAVLAVDEREVRLTLVSAADRVRLGETAVVRFLLDGAEEPPVQIGVLVMNASGVGIQRHLAAMRIDTGVFEARVPMTEVGATLVMPDPVTLPARMAGRPVATIRVEP